MFFEQRFLMSKTVARMLSAWGLSIALLSANTASAQEFTLVKGRGTEVCEAYAKRLNESEGSRQTGSFCGRPEDTSVPGFTKLGRVKLSYDELYDIGDLLLGFSSNSDQDYLQKLYAAQLAVCDQPGREKYCEHILAHKRAAESLGLRWHSQLDTSAMRWGKEFAWRYEPAIDIDNDSKPDPVLLFQRRCDGVQLGGTYAYVMADDSYRRIDEARTRTIFGHPHQQWPDGLENYQAFRYIELRNGVFSYLGQFYFDTYYWRGDLDNERRDDPTISRTLGVFRHHEGRTERVCEILWNPPATFYEK